MKCLVPGCPRKAYDLPLTSFSRHIQKQHHLTTKDYTVKYLLQNVSQKCKIDNCNEEPRYVSFGFKTYCKKHSSIGKGIRERKMNRQFNSREMVEFIKSLGFDFKRNVKNLIPSHDLSIYIPEKRLAIEYYELGKHIEEIDGKNTHNEKAIKCFEKGIQLIQIFEDEWKNKPDICKSMIMHRLGITKERLYARKCRIEEISGTESNQFFNQSHIAGGTRARIHFALKDKNDRIVSVLSLRKPVQKKKDNHLTDGIIEIARFATLPYVHISGGFSKLFKAALNWSREEKYKKILTYAELRFGEGKVYFSNGFKYRGKTASPMYWYVKTWEGTNLVKCKDVIEGKRYFRFFFRAQRPLTEKMVADEAGVKKLYGTVNNAFEWVL